MGRIEAVARSIVRAIVGGAKKRSRSPITFILAFFSTIFSFYELPLHKHRADVFKNLRKKWEILEDDYLASFRAEEGDKPEDALFTMANMGFSGSTFFSTLNQKFLVKSVPRSHEHTFFRNDLLDTYAAHVATHPESLLVRICDFLASSGKAIGHQLGLAPSHHIVMENIMYGQDEAKQAGRPDWENWDLKPTSYFYPERDIAEGRLTSEATKSQLADDFHDKIILTKEQAENFWRNLEEDTRMLAHYNAVDYSLFLVRIQPNEPAPEASNPSPLTASPGTNINADPRDPPPVAPGPPSWRTGVPSADGKYVYRAAVLDFFWAKHKVQREYRFSFASDPLLSGVGDGLAQMIQFTRFDDNRLCIVAPTNNASGKICYIRAGLNVSAKIMTLLVSLYNTLISHHGPMSITTTPEEYRERFLKLTHDIVEVRTGEETTT